MTRSKRNTLCFTICLWLICSALSVMAQQTASTDSVVPFIMKFTGTLSDSDAKPLTGTQGATFLLYKEQTGGAPLWMETQNVQSDNSGRYSVTLGSATRGGLPANAFSAGEARWLAVQPSGQAEQPRTLLVSVPYALKAADAETIGGLPPSAFLRVDASHPASAKQSAAPSTKPAAVGANPAVTGKGILNYIPMWDATNDIVDSLIFQKSAAVGVNTKTPAATLDVNGKSAVRDTLTLYPKGTDATLAINGTTFSVASTGKVTFAAGQTFPGSGTVSSVALTAPSSDFTVSGSPIKKSGTLALNWTIAPTDVNTPDAIVKRDATGSFSSGSIFIKSDDVGVTVFGANNGLYGNTNSASGNGVWGFNPNHTGVYGDGAVGVWGHSGSGYGVYGASYGTNASADGVHGLSNSAGASGVAGVNNANGVGVYGAGGSGGTGVTGTGSNGVLGYSSTAGGVGVGAYNSSSGDALFAENQSGGFAAFFLGDVDVDGNLSKAAGSFKIDHPIDPANKYLYHSFVESPDMMNIYNGNVTTNAQGLVVVHMPDWFEALNRDFRYQLTVMGQFAQAIVASKMANHAFTIKTDKPNVEVSWQVTGVRHDAWADAHRIPVEVAKPAKERGSYLHPELFGAPASQSLVHVRHPELEKVAKPETARAPESSMQ
jgi:trimeric autotransporter adhesin